MRLVIETAGPVCSVALIDGGTLIAYAHETVQRAQAERLLPMIALLPDGGRADEILVDCGPGSFTGIRVGLAAAIGLGIGWGVPVGGYSSLALIAARHAADGAAEPFCVAIPGGHGQVFAQNFAAGPLRAGGAAASLDPDAARALSGGRPMVGGGVGLDARNALLLPASFASLPPRPIYGRAADAKPMA